MTALGRLLRAPLGLLTTVCVLIGGWSLWTGGIFDGAIASTVRTASVYAAAGSGLDAAAASQAIGNRRLVVILLAPDAPDGALRDACEQVEDAADGTVVLVMSRVADDYDTYGCALLPDRDDENFGKAYVTEAVIGSGIDIFVDEPLQAVKLIAVNYDQLVRSGTVPDGARVISPSLPRYLLAAAALLAVMLGAAFIYLSAARVGRTAAGRVAARERRDDQRSELSAGAAVLAQQLIELDSRYERLTGSRTGTTLSRSDRAFVNGYRNLVADYTDLMRVITDADRDGHGGARGSAGDVSPALDQRVRSLSDRAGDLAGLRGGARPA